VADPSGSTELRKNPTGTVETFEVFASRDPFAPLVTDEDEGKTGEDGGSGRDANVVGLKGVSGASGPGRAEVEVNDTIHPVTEGEVFAENFKLLFVSGDCASMLFGDDQFTMCEGEEILK
jgi:hypothetical protein